ncbi:MAG: hypothetical protein JNM68_07855, partial [Dinghuibacter sp.]|nr:hypothetical protein [Dinghuibacter sp.]
AARVPWCALGHTLPERPQFVFDPVFHAGGYYVQEASSMFLEQAITQHAPIGGPLTVLDLCAAPGGKSTHLVSLLPENSILVSNEVIRTRVHILAENITRWGAANVVVTQNDPADFGALHEQFDIIVADAPCSGSGLFRKDAAAANEGSGANVALCAQRQQRIIADVWPALKPGGLFVYATCSYSPEENELIGEWLTDTFQPQPLEIKTEPGWGITPVQTGNGATGYRFWPHKVQGEGFFMAAFRKSGESGYSTAPAGRKKPGTLFSPVAKNEWAKLPEWLVSNHTGEVVLRGEEYIQLPETLYNWLQQLPPALYIKQAGTTWGKMAGKDFIPDHALAMNPEKATRHRSLELNREQALKFLKKETFETGSAEKGWWLARYEAYPLGWLKHLGNRVNNYYPVQLRILKDLPL